MTAMLDQFIRSIAEEGLQINIWPAEVGFRINVKERSGDGWTIVAHADPVEGLETALRQRLSRSSLRHVVVDPEPAQMDIEDAIEAADGPGGDLDDLIG